MYGDIIKRIRKAKGFTQKEVYSDVVSKTFYSDFEAGKYSISIEKFEGLLSNLGISYTEFEHFKMQDQQNEVSELDDQIDKLYKNGKFEELYDIYEENRLNRNREIRYLAINAYLLVLITNRNFYKFSRDPFNEIISDIKNAKMWTLKEIKIAKLVLLSLSEKNKNQAETLFVRILKELSKYEKFDSRLYFEEVGDLFFNRIQSLLVINDMKLVKTTLDDYTAIISKSDHLHLVIQLKFITILVNLYLDYPNYEEELQNFLNQIKKVPTSETHFYEIIAQIHKEKAKNYYTRYGNS